MGQGESAGGSRRGESAGGVGGGSRRGELAGGVGGGSRRGESVKQQALHDTLGKKSHEKKGWKL